MVAQTQTLTQRLQLAPKCHKILEKKWSKIVSDPLAFVPSDLKTTPSTAEVLLQNEMLGEFAIRHLKETLHAFYKDKDSNLVDQKKIIATGFGRNYDSNWLQEAVTAGLETWWIDISQAACAMATNSMRTQWDFTRQTGAFAVSEPKVKQAEICWALKHPETIELDLHTVKVWYFCRMLSFLPERNAKTILRTIGETFSKKSDPEKGNRIVIVNALTDYNEGYRGTTSRLHSKDFILTHLKKGAKRSLDIVSNGIHQYFHKNVSALTITAT